MIGQLWCIQPLGRHATLLVMFSVHCLVGLDSNESGSFSKDAATRRKQRSKQLSAMIVDYIIHYKIHYISPKEK